MLLVHDITNLCLTDVLSVVCSDMPVVDFSASDPSTRDPPTILLRKNEFDRFLVEDPDELLVTGDTLTVSQLANEANHACTMVGMQLVVRVVQYCR